MADWSFPKLSSLYVDVINMLKARDDDSAKMFSGTGSSLKEGFVTWNAGASKFEIVLADGASKQDLTITYDINVSRLGGNNALYFLPSEDFNPQAILDNIKIVDGAGSGLDCDFFRGLAPASFATSVQGGKADTALQDAGAFATAEQGIKADNALPASSYTPSDFVRTDGVQALSIDALRQSGDSISLHKGDGTSESLSVVSTTSARALHADALRVSGANIQLVKASGASEVVDVGQAYKFLAYNSVGAEVIARLQPGAYSATNRIASLGTLVASSWLKSDSGQSVGGVTWMCLGYAESENYISGAITSGLCTWKRVV